MSARTRFVVSALINNTKANQRVSTGMFSMNVNVPNNGSPGDPPSSKYTVFGLVILGCCCVGTLYAALIRYWWFGKAQTKGVIKKGKKE
jgi:hypothetical protein